MRHRALALAGPDDDRVVAAVQPGDLQLHVVLVRPEPGVGRVDRVDAANIGGDDGRLVGVVSMGDLAVEWEPDSVLADISTDDPNN